MEKSKIILAFDTCLTNSIALYNQGNIVSMDLDSQEKLNKPSHILPLIDQALTEAGLTIKEVEALALLTGPGSFTGIRIGIAMAKAFAISSNIKLVTVNTFEAIKENASLENSFAIILNAGGGYYYYGDETTLKEDEDLQQIELMKRDAIEKTIGTKETIILFGGRLQQVKEKLDEAGLRYTAVDTKLAESVLNTAIEKLRAGKIKSTADLQPVYIKPSYVEI